MEYKYGLAMNSFERNVVQIALTHLQEEQDYLITETNDAIQVKYHQDVVKACEEMLKSLK